MKKRKSVVVAVASLGIAVDSVYAIRARASGIPSANAMSYAGVLENATGPITGTPNIQVVVYDAPTGGSNLCQTTSAPTTVSNGHFAVSLPDGCTSAIGANAATFVDVLVDGSDTGRRAVGAVPYAVEAKHAVNADNVANADNAKHAITADNATNAGHATSADSATNAGHAGTADSAASAAAASGSLALTITTIQSNIGALQGAPSAITSVMKVDAVPGDSWYSDCVSPGASTSFAVGACPRMAFAKCQAVGYKGGWFEGDIASGHVGVVCIK